MVGAADVVTLVFTRCGRCVGKSVQLALVVARAVGAVTGLLAVAAVDGLQRVVFNVQSV